MEESSKIKVIFEDNHLLVVEKPKNIPVQEDSSKDTDFLSMLKEYRRINENKKNDAYVGLVHRLDRPVSGIMVFAKTSKCASRLASQIQNHEFKKIYYAVVENKLSQKGHLVDYLAKNKKDNISYVTDKDHGKIAILDYEVISSKDNLNLVKIDLQTGRSHQIRVQFSSRNNPIVGDKKYNPKSEVKDIALFASSISFKHPITKENLTFSLDLPCRYPFNYF